MKAINYIHIPKMITGILQNRYVLILTMLPDKDNTSRQSQITILQILRTKQAAAMNPVKI